MPLLSEEEHRQLALLAVYGADGEALSTTELAAIANWAEDVRCNNGLLDNALDGSVFVRWDTEKHEPTFRLSPKGMREAEQLMKQTAQPGEPT